MVLVTVNPKHNESTISKGLLEQSEKEQLRFNSSAFPTVRDLEKVAFEESWDEELCTRLDRVAREDHSYIATWDERRGYEKNWKLGLSTQGPVGPMKSASDFSEAVQKICEIRREAGQKIDVAILPCLQVRQRSEQSFHKSDTWTVDPRTGWIWWSSPESSASSTIWWRSSFWWSYSNWEEH